MTVNQTPWKQWEAAIKMRSNQTLLPDLFPSQILIRWNMSPWLRAFHTLFSEHRRSTLICCSRSRHPPSHHLVSCIITEATSTEGHRNSLANFYRLGKNWLTKIQTFYTAFCFIWTKRASSVLLKKNLSSSYQVTFYSTLYVHCFLPNSLLRIIRAEKNCGSGQATSPSS